MLLRTLWSVLSVSLSISICRSVVHATDCTDTVETGSLVVDSRALVSGTDSHAYQGVRVGWNHTDTSDDRV